MIAKFIFLLRRRIFTTTTAALGADGANFSPKRTKPCWVIRGGPFDALMWIRCYIPFQ